MPQKNVASNTEKSLLVIVVKVLVHNCFAKLQKTADNTKEKEIFLFVFPNESTFELNLKSTKK